MKLNLILFPKLLPAIRNVSGSSSARLWLSAHKTPVFSIHLSQGNVATRLSCGGIFDDSFIANFSQCLSKNMKTR